MDRLSNGSAWKSAWYLGEAFGEVQAGGLTGIFPSPYFLWWMHSFSYARVFAHEVFTWL